MLDRYTKEHYPIAQITLNSLLTPASVGNVTISCLANMYVYIYIYIYIQPRAEIKKVTRRARGLMHNGFIFLEVL